MESTVGCLVAGCDRKHYGLGLCSAHYQQFRNSGKITRLQVGQRPPRKTCTVEGCTNPMVGKGLCNTHRIRMKRHGSVHVNLGWGGDSPGNFKYRYGKGSMLPAPIHE